jgi:cytidine deaminase
MRYFINRETILAAARSAALNAHAPYTGYRVGAAVVTQVMEQHRIVTGFNIEHGYRVLTICAERAAVIAAFMAIQRSATTRPSSNLGTRKPTVTFVGIACIDEPPEAPICRRMPCDLCRHWLGELAPEAVYYFDGIDGEFRLAGLEPRCGRFAEIMRALPLISSEWQSPPDGP